VIESKSKAFQLSMMDITLVRLQSKKSSKTWLFDNTRDRQAAYLWIKAKQLAVATLARVL
jgi:hypothetical protein